MSALIIIVAALGAAQPPTLAIGASAPDFTLPGIDGKTYRLADFAGPDVLVIVFTCNHCPTAQAYEERILQLSHAYDKQKVALVAITPNDPLAVRLDELGYTDLSDSFEETKQRAQERGFDFPYLYDGEKQEAARAYGPVSTPHVFVFDKQRTLRFAGRIDNSEKPDKVTTHDTSNAIEALLAGTPVPVETTKTFGCSVKWSDKRDSVKAGIDAWAKEEVTVEKIGSEGVKKLIANDSNKLRLINIWTTWCGPCVTEFPDMVTIHRMYRKRDFELVTISADDPSNGDRVLDFLKKQQASTINYHFEGKEPYELVDTVDKDWPGAIPYTLLVAPGGKVLHRNMGAINPQEMKKTIVDYLGRVY